MEIDYTRMKLVFTKEQEDRDTMRISYDITGLDGFGTDYTPGCPRFIESRKHGLLTEYSDRMPELVAETMRDLIRHIKEVNEYGGESNAKKRCYDERSK